MSTFCRCGKLATHRVAWNPWVDAAEPSRSRRPAYCRGCAVAEAQRRTVERHETEAYEREFHPATREVYRTVAPMPHAWSVLMRNQVRRHADLINPGGLVNLFKRRGSGGHMYVELFPPQERPASWSAENCLYLLRYLTRLPLVFERVEPESLTSSPSTWRESARQSADTAGPILTPDGSPTAPIGTGGDS